MAPVPRVARFNEELAQGAGKSIEECEMRVEDYFRRRCHVMCVLESTIGEFAEQGVRAVFVDGERRAWADVGDAARVVVRGGKAASTWSDSPMPARQASFSTSGCWSTRHAPRDPC